MSKFSTFTKWVLLSLSLYAVAWTISYVGMFLLRGDGLSAQYYFEYLMLGWSFSGGELPSYIWLYSMVIFLAMITSVVIAKCFCRKK